MNIEPVNIPGVFIVKRDPFSDERGSFARLFCKRELEAAGLSGEIAQVNLSANIEVATLRGLHSQNGGEAEDKLVTCIAGAVFDVCVDVREDSATFGKWYAEELSADNGLALYVPKGFAHGYLTLTGSTQVLYFVTQFYMPEAEVGYRYDEPFFGIDWPLTEPYIISDKDKNWKYLELAGNQK